ncbi:MAG: hypothetical protein ACYS9Y_01690 [Planctomycetota bacterium]|jgi:hypothetical protein
MMKKEFVSVVKVGVLAVFVMCLLFVQSCKKSEPDDSAEGTRQQGGEVTKDSGETTPQAAEKLEPLDIKLPRAMFVGTPKPARVPNLEKPLGKDRPPFLAPPGVTNISFGKPVTSTDPEPIIGEIEMITDGDKEAADGSYVEFGPMKQSITIDLGAEYELYAILFWHYHKEGLVYFDVVVQVAGDPDFIMNVKTLYNNDDDNSSGLGKGDDMHYVETNEGRLVDAKGFKGRYVRLHSNGNNANEYNHYIEVEVFGRAVK